ncbi:hypothetical protein ACOMHN_039033 [Nucella lapillus]
MTLVYFFLDFSAWVLALLSLERLLSVRWTMVCYHRCTRVTSVIAMVIVGAVLFALNSPFLFLFGDIEGSHGITLRCVPLSKENHHFVTMVWPWIDMTAFALLPLTIHVVCNILIIQGVSRSFGKSRRSRGHRRNLQSDPTSGLPCHSNGVHHNGVSAGSRNGCGCSSDVSASIHNREFRETLQGALRNISSVAGIGRSVLDGCEALQTTGCCGPQDQGSRLENATMDNTAIKEHWTNETGSCSGESATLQTNGAAVKPLSIVPPVNWDAHEAGHRFGRVSFHSESWQSDDSESGITCKVSIGNGTCGSAKCPQSLKRQSVCDSPSPVPCTNSSLVDPTELSELTKNSEQMQCAKDNERTDIIMHSEQTGFAKEYEQTEHSKDSEQTEHSKDNEQTEHYKDNEQTEHSKDSEQTEHSKDNEQTEHSKDSEQTEHSKDSEQTEHYKDNEQTEHSKDSEQTEHSKDSEQTEHSKDSEQTEHYKDNEQTEHYKDMQQTEHSKDKEQTEHSKDNEQTEHSKDNEQTERTIIADSQQTDLAKDMQQTEPIKNNGQAAKAREETDSTEKSEEHTQHKTNNETSDGAATHTQQTPATHTQQTPATHTQQTPATHTQQTPATWTKKPRPKGVTFQVLPGTTTAAAHSPEKTTLSGSRRKEDLDHQHHLGSSDDSSAVSLADTNINSSSSLRSSSNNNNEKTTTTSNNTTTTTTSNNTTTTTTSNNTTTTTTSNNTTTTTTSNNSSRSSSNNNNSTTTTITTSNNSSRSSNNNNNESQSQGLETSAGRRETTNISGASFPDSAGGNARGRSRRGIRRRSPEEEGEVGRGVLGGGVEEERMVMGMRRTLVGVSVMFCLTTFPISLFLIIRWFHTSMQHAEEIYAALGILMYTNNASNFILYCLTSSSFRSEMAAMGRQLLHVCRRILHCCQTRCLPSRLLPHHGRGSQSSSRQGGEWKVSSVWKRWWSRSLSRTSRSSRSLSSSMASQQTYASSLSSSVRSGS